MLSTVKGCTFSSWAKVGDEATVECKVYDDEAEFTFSGGMLELSFTRDALEKLVAEGQSALRRMAQPSGT